ncbi:glycosyltransferase family 39 protein [bacterium]|nr:glycosyltransferase family 39 protein [bacterium]
MNYYKLPYLIFTLASIAIGFFFAHKISNSSASRHQKSPQIIGNDLFLLIFAILGGTLLRIYGVDFGLPRAYHPDELQKATLLSKMVKNQTIDPNYAALPPLLLYLSWFVAQPLEWLNYPEGNSVVRYLLSGRIVNVITGSLSIYLIYCIGRRLSSSFTGVLAALFLAFSPLHVTNSRYMKEDALFVFFTLACVLAVLKAIQAGKLRYLYFAGFLAGVSFGAKYTGLVTIACVLAVPWLKSERLTFKPDLTLLKHSLAATLLMPVGFLATMPYVFLSLDRFTFLYYGIRTESLHAMRGHLGLVIDAWSQFWMYHLSTGLIPGVSLLVLTFALLQTGITLRDLETKFLLIVGGMLIFYIPPEWAVSKPPPQPDRYVLACVPFIALLAAEFIRRLNLEIFNFKLISANQEKFRTGLLSLTLLFPLLSTLKYTSEIYNDTRKQASNWLAGNMPPQTKVIVAGGTVYLPPIPSNIIDVTIRDFAKATKRDRKPMIEKLKSSEYQYLIVSDFDAKRFDPYKPKRKSRFAIGLRAEVDKTFRIVKQFRSKYGSYGFHHPVVTIYQLKS